MPLSHASSSSRARDIPPSPAPESTNSRGNTGQGLLGSAVDGAAVAGGAVVGQASDPVLQNVYMELEKMLSNSLGTLVNSDTGSDDKAPRRENNATSQATQAGSQLSAAASADPQAGFKTLLDNIASGHGGGAFGGLSAQKIMENAPPGSSNLTWNCGTLTDTELQIVSVLDRHKDQCPLSWGSLQDKANDPSTPADLKAAIQGLQNDPQLFYAIGSQGDGKCGGKIKAKDLSSFSANHAQVASFKESQASSYEQNYIPSDGTGNGQPSVMTENDAMRELYRYSDNLPPNLSLADFQQIVDGDAKTGKTPPQVIAAAKYFVDHPDQWKQLFGGNVDKVHTSDFLQVASSSMHLTQAELGTLDTIDKNQKAFFGNGDLTRDKLSSMANDKSLDPQVKQAASQLLSDPLLFGVLNNSITGYKTHHGFFDMGGGHTVDSGNVSNNDFTHFYDNMSEANRTVQKTATHAPTTAADQDAVADMTMGTADQPDIKSPKHNGGALLHVLDEGLKIGAMALDWGATALGALSFIPGIGELADVGSALLEGESQAMNIARTVLDGGNLKKALEEAGLSMAAQAVGDIAGPEAKIAMRDGLAKTLIEKAATAGMNMPVQAAQYYAVSAMNNMKSRLEGNPTQGIFSFTQSMAEGGLNSMGDVLDGISGPKAKFASMSEGMAKKAMEKAATAATSAPLSAAKYYAQSDLTSLQMEVAQGPTQPTNGPTQVNPV